MDLMTRVYLTQQEMLKFIKEKQQDSLSPNLRKYYEARQEMNDWLEQDDVPEDTKATMYAQQLQRVNQLKNQVVYHRHQNVLQAVHLQQVRQVICRNEESQQTSD